MVYSLCNHVHDTNRPRRETARFWQLVPAPIAAALHAADHACRLDFRALVRGNAPPPPPPPPPPPLTRSFGKAAGTADAAHGLGLVAVGSESAGDDRGPFAGTPDFSESSAHADGARSGGSSISSAPPPPPLEEEGQADLPSRPKEPPAGPPGSPSRRGTQEPTESAAMADKTALAAFSPGGMGPAELQGNMAACEVSWMRDGPPPAVDREPVLSGSLNESESEHGSNDSFGLGGPAGSARHWREEDSGLWGKLTEEVRAVHARYAAGEHGSLDKEASKVDQASR